MGHAGRGREFLAALKPLAAAGALTEEQVRRIKKDTRPRTRVPEMKYPAE